jgi:hypothetical protein
VGLGQFVVLDSQSSLGIPGIGVDLPHLCTTFILDGLSTPGPGVAILWPVLEFRSYEALLLFLGNILSIDLGIGFDWIPFLIMTWSAGGLYPAGILPSRRGHDS